ncbi:hypothetical protein H0H87_007773 [Tephrocybe sp. NHM501043]|nr:hypothetical protein H0H87_007773 [Tephrocybe sp. NHM501043]
MSQSLVQYPASSPFIERSGRWHTSDTGSLIASWCGASLKFSHTGRSLSIKIGALAERKDRFNGGTPMLACVISQDSKEDEIALYDPEPLKTVDLFIAKSEDDVAKERVVELTLIDWASILEIEEFIVFPADSISKPRHVDYIRSLHIGDSISCGFSDGSMRVPRGCLDAFPFLVRDALRKEGVMIEIDMVAFPGASLTDPTEEEIESEGNLPKGLGTRFSHASPWSESEYEDERLPAQLLVVALGTNDEARDVTAARYQASLLGLISKVHILNADSLKHIVVLHPFPDFTEEDEEEFPVSSAESSLDAHIPTFVDTLRTSFPHITITACNIGKGITEECTMDGLHPTVDGQAALATAWLGEARNIIRGIYDAQ